MSSAYCFGKVRLKFTRSHHKEADVHVNAVCCVYAYRVYNELYTYMYAYASVGEIEHGPIIRALDALIGGPLIEHDPTAIRPDAHVSNPVWFSGVQHPASVGHRAPAAQL